MSKSKVEMSFLTQELLIDGKVATTDVLVALMQHMNLRREDNPKFFYHVEGLGELCFTSDRHLAEERKAKYADNYGLSVTSTNTDAAESNHGD